MEDINKWLKGLQWRKFAFKDIIVRQFDSNYSLCVKRLFQQVIILLLSFIHKLSLFAIIFKFFLDTLVVEFFIFIELLFFIELKLHPLDFLGFQLEYFYVSVFDWLWHHFLSSSFLFSEHVIKNYWSLTFNFHLWLVQRNNFLLIRVKGDLLTMLSDFMNTLIQ